MNKLETTYQNFSGIELQNLLSSAVSGSSDSFIKISAQVRNIAFSYFKSKYRAGKLNCVDDAEDLANNVYLTFAEQYQDIENIEKWLRRVMFLVFVKWYKKQKSSQHFELNEAIYNKTDDTDLDARIDAVKLLSVINQLNETKKSIIKLRYWKGLKFKEIAEKLGKNEAAVKKMFYRIIDEIKIKLE